MLLKLLIKQRVEQVSAEYTPQDMRLLVYEALSY
jgi:hypothetical protein